MLLRARLLKAPLSTHPDSAHTVAHRPDEWRPRIRRCGALALKLGMMSFWDRWGVRHPVTVLHLADCVALKSHPLDRATIQEVGIGTKSLKKIHCAQLSYFAGCQVSPKRCIAGFNVDKRAVLPVGTPIKAAHFVAGQRIDAQARTIGKGFQGGMKRWGFSGMPASHGVSLSHRSIGATGQREDPSGVMKGKKMPGRMGGTNATAACLQVMKVDNSANCLLVRGSVPGPDGGIVRVWDSIHRQSTKRFLEIRNAKQGEQPLPFPTVDPNAELPREYTAPAPSVDPLVVKEL